MVILHQNSCCCCYCLRLTVIMNGKRQKKRSAKLLLRHQTPDKCRIREQYRCCCCCLRFWSKTKVSLLPSNLESVIGQCQVLLMICVCVCGGADVGEKEMLWAVLRNVFFSESLTKWKEKAGQFVLLSSSALRCCLPTAPLLRLKLKFVNWNGNFHKFIRYSKFCTLPSICNVISLGAPPHQQQ